MKTYDVDVFCSVSGTVRGIRASSEEEAQNIARQRLETGEGFWQFERRFTPRLHQPPCELRAGTLHITDQAGKTIQEIPVDNVEITLEGRRGKNGKPQKQR